MKNLVIVESPTKARTLTRFLGSDYRIEATMGHIRDLPKSKLGLDIEHDFKPSYQIIAGRTKRIAELKSYAKEASLVILATDPDREGEAIAWHIAYLLKLDVGGRKLDKEVRSGKLERIVFHEITEGAIKDALTHPREIDIKLVDAQQARRVLDRLVGYKLSPLLWNKLGKNWLSAGRVQSVAVRLIVEREREIESFKPQEYWVIEVELEKHSQNVIASVAKQSLEIASSLSAPRNDKSASSFLARLDQIDEKKTEVKDKKTADGIVVDLEKASYTVKNIEMKEIRRYPSPPFTTSTLQQAAANRYGWSAKRTMQTAQKLYEEGYITYHRTDSTNLSKESIQMVRDYILNLYGQVYLPAAAKFYKTKSKVAQEAHEAIRPTDVGQITNSKIQITNTLGRESDRLYELIWKRFVACQMNEAVFEQTGVDIEALSKSLQADAKQSLEIATGSSTPRNDKSHTYLLRATGQRTKFDGFLKVYDNEVKSQKSKVKSEQGIGYKKREEEGNKELPQLSSGELLNLLQLLPQQKFTQPPPRYNEASLIKILEEKGIGRPSTYAPTISTIQDRRYVEKVERKFQPTDLGIVVNDFLVLHFPDIFDVSFTAKMEDDLDKIATGEMNWIPVIHEFYDPLALKIQSVYKDAEKVKVNYGTTDEKCPTCGNPLVVRMSKYGKFLACSTFPKCKFTKNIIEKTGLVCPQCRGDIIMRRTRGGKQFYGCSNYPTCTFAAWKKEEIMRIDANK